MGYFSSGLARESLRTSFLLLQLGGGAGLAGLVDRRTALLLLLDRCVVALRRLIAIGAPPVRCISCCTSTSREVGRRKLMLGRWWTLLYLTAGVGKAVEGKPGRAWAVVAEVAGKVCLRVTPALAFLCAMIMRATDLAENSGTRVGLAAEHC